MLDDVDTSLLRSALKVSAKASRALLFLELGICSVEFILKKMRVGYLHHLITVKEPSLAKDVFREQVRAKGRGDLLLR